MGKKASGIQKRSQGSAKSIIAIIQSEAEERCKAIQIDAEKKVEEMGAKHDRNLAAEMKVLEYNTQRRLEMMENRSRADAVLYRSRCFSRAKEGFFSVVKADVQEALVSHRKEQTSQYTEYMKRAMEDAKKLFGGGTARVAKGDRTQEAIGNTGFSVTEDLPENALGGAIFSSKDGERNLDATLQHMLDRDMTAIRSMVMGEVFPMAEETEKESDD